MKRISIALIAFLIFLLCGYRAMEATNASDYKSSISKAQEIAVIPVNTSEITKTITTPKDVDNFVSALEIENWKLKSLPDTASEVGSFEFSQEQTIKLLQTTHDGTFSHIATITVYDSPYICLEFCGLDMTFEVSPDTADYLMKYFE